MTGGTKPAGKMRFDLVHATFEFIELAAIIALEMMMMFLAGNLIPGGVSRNFDRSQPAIFD